MAPDDMERIAFHIRKAVEAAMRKGTTITFSKFAARLRAKIPSVTVDDATILEQLVHPAKDSGVVIEIDHTA